MRKRGVNSRVERVERVVNTDGSSALWKDTQGFHLLLTISACLGLFVNQWRDKPLPWVYETKQQRLDSAVANLAARNTVPISEHPQSIELVAVQAMLKSKQALILDARPEIFHRLGHIPGAISLPREDFEKAFEYNRALLESHKVEPIVVYCSSNSCEDSMMVAESLVKLGYRRILVFKGGWDEWSGAQLETEKRKDF